MQGIQNKYATLSKYILLKTLGQGYNSKVKLGYDPSANQYFAVKIIKHSHPSLSLKTLKNEIEILQHLKHPNIVNLIDFQESATYIKKNGTSYKAVAIIMELVPGGELFEYVAESGRFAEDVARTYFRILIETLEYCYGQGIVHRDLKPENLLFDANFNLKVADFGFATLLCGKDDTGKLHTILGTESYMAPEIHLRKPYSGTSVDLFAAGIILFIMISGTPPFARADPRSDAHYKLICNKNYEVFWKAHEKNKPKGPNGENFYSDEFRNFINGMLALDPAERPDIETIKGHPWYQGAVCDLSALKLEFGQRKKKVDAKLQKQIEAKQQQKLMAQMKSKNTLTAFTGIRPFRSLETEAEDQLAENLREKVNLEAKRELQEYQAVAGFKAYTEVFTVMSPDFIFKVLCDICQTELSNFDVSDTQYKIKGKATRDEGSCNLAITLTKVDDSTTCVEFQKKSGLALLYYKVVDEIKKNLPSVQVEGEDEVKN